MKDKYQKYLKEIGIDVEKGGHPFADEYLKIKSLNHESSTLSFEHLLLMLMVDLEQIKKHNSIDYDYYKKKIRITKESFWGERNEIYWYSSLLCRNSVRIENLRRGFAGLEADFLFTYSNQETSIEVTSVRYGPDSVTQKPITKIKNTIGKKEKAKYCNTNCCLVIDYTNLNFYRKIEDNFSTSITDLISNLASNFGAILFSFNSHHDNHNPKYSTQFFKWVNKGATPQLIEFLDKITNKPSSNQSDKMFFRVG